MQNDSLRLVATGSSKITTGSQKEMSFFLKNLLQRADVCAVKHRFNIYKSGFPHRNGIPLIVFVQSYKEPISPPTDDYSPSHTESTAAAWRIIRTTCSFVK